MASWALSFERLLQDPLGLAYFTVSPGVGCSGIGGWDLGVGRCHCRHGGFWRGHRQGFGLVRVLLLFVVSQLARLWHPFPHHQAGNSSFSLFLSLLLGFFFLYPRSGTICLSVWSLGPCLSQSLNTSLFQPVSEAFLHLVLMPGVPEEGIQRRERNFLESLRAFPADPSQ